jgi:hypothetical protein
LLNQLSLHSDPDTYRSCVEDPPPGRALGISMLRLVLRELVVLLSHGGFCSSSQALDLILGKMKSSGFDFSQVLALSGAGQVCKQQLHGPCELSYLSSGWVLN